MPQTVYKLYASVTVSTDAAAQLDIQKAGVIEAILLNYDVQGADALNDGGGVEISFSSVNGHTANDTRASIASTYGFQGFLTSGGGPVGNAIFLSGLDIPVGAGERVWMHISVIGTATVRARGFLYVSDGAAFRPGTRARA